MKVNMNLSKSVGILIGLLLLTGLVGCGGGGSSGPTTVTPKELPSALVVSSSAGSLSRYAGTWSSDCGRTVTGSPLVQSAKNTYVFSSPTGTTVIGTLSQEQYTDTECSKRLFNISVPTVVQGISLINATTVSADVAVPKTQFDNFTGTVDQVTLTLTTQGGAASSSIYYVGFSDNYRTLRLTTALPFSVFTVVYEKGGL